jgi:tetratricopeptide (TPR) repeat protein
MSSGDDLYEEQLNRGIINSEPYSYLLIKEARANAEKADSILKKALRYSPDLPAVYFELSRSDFSFAPEGIFKAVDYTLQGVTAYKRNFWWLFTIVGSLFTSAILAIVGSIIVIVLVRLPVDLPLLSHDIKEEKNRALLLLLILVSALACPIFLMGGILIIIGLYMKKWDRVSVYLYLGFLLISPWLLNTASTFFNTAVSGEIKAVVQVNESMGNRYALSVLKGKDNPVELFSYALAMKREGGYDEAINIYNELIANKPGPKLYNNLANCYFAINDIEKAKELYRKSIQLQPVATAFYNLSEVSRETLDFEKGDEYFLSAQKLDRDAVSMFRRIFSRNPNRFVIDENLPMSTIWGYAEEKATRASTIDLSIVPPALMPVIALLMVILFYIFTGRVKYKAYRCKRCGTILCNKCEKHILWGRMCLQCYRSLIKLDELDAKERIARLLTVYEYQKGRRDIIKVLSFIMPGSGQIYAGNVLYGLLFLWPFLFLLFIPITNLIFIPETYHFSHTWLSLCSLLLMLVVYFVSNILTRRRLAKGWL